MKKPGALVLVACLLLSPALQAGAGDETESPATLEQETIRRTNELYDAAFVGRRTEEAARDIEVRIGALLQGNLMQTAPRIVELYGGLAGMFFAASRHADAEAVVRRLYQFSHEAKNDTLLVSGLRKMLAVPALRSFARRDNEIRVLETLLKELGDQGKWSQEDQLDERFYVALLDCIGTAHMLDRNGSLALRFYQEARVRGVAAYRNIKLENRMFREAFSITCRIFPLSGLVSTYLLMGQMEEALEISDELVAVASALSEGRLLPEGHPARMTSEGAILMLGEAYTRSQEEKARSSGMKLPMTLKERRNWRVHQERARLRVEELAKDRERRGLARRSPFQLTPAPENTAADEEGP